MTSDALLAVSIFLSVKTIQYATLKSIFVLKPYRRFTTNLVLVLWTIVSSSTRVMAIVFFFIPGFGLFSILGHWKLEQTPYSSTVNDRFQDDNTVYLYKAKPIPWPEINRYNYTSDSAPHYSIYTYLSLSEYFLAFWISLFLHTCINCLVKIIFSEDFRKSPSPLLFKFIHCVENTNIPTVWTDWEEKKGSIEDHKKKHGNVLKEMTAIMIIRTIFNSLMLVPILYTGKTIKRYIWFNVIVNF